jgi:hypothetical protein
MDETRDTELGRQLETLGEPDHGPGYWPDVRLRMAEAAAARRPGFGHRLRAAFAPRLARLALAAAALVAVATAMVLVGLPGTPGSPSVSAAEVLDRALETYSSGHTWQADVLVKLFDADAWARWHAYVTRRLHVVQGADGGSRLTAGPVMAAGHRLDHPYTEVYDATTGKGAYYDAEARTWVVERNQPLGPPDGGTIPLLDAAAVCRALAASKTLRLDDTVVGGRPAWTVTCTKGEMAGLPPSNVDWPVYTVTIDKQTGLLLRAQEVQAGSLTFSCRYSNVRVDEPLPEHAFTQPLPRGEPVKRIDRGFRRVPLDEAAAARGVTPLVPGFVPGGYELSGVAVAARAVTAIEVVSARHVFALQYTRGFDALTVSTRTVDNWHYTVDVDPCDEFDQAWSKLARTVVTIKSGAFAGAKARILVASTTSAPHLWAVKDGVLLTIAGGATAKELLAVAESLQVYPGP